MLLNRLKFALLLSVIALFSSCSFNLPTTNTRPDISYSDNKELAKRNQIVEFAKQQIGSRYKYAGRDPKGFDCSGFTHYVMKHFDVNLSPSSSAQSNQGRKIDLRSAKTGDLIFFKRPTENRIFHVALVVNNNHEGLKVIHSTSSKGVRIDNVSTSSYWKPKIYSARNVVAK